MGRMSVCEMLNKPISLCYTAADVPGGSAGGALHPHTADRSNSPIAAVDRKPRTLDQRPTNRSAVLAALTSS
jgi:hypothetical protein